MKDGRAKPAPAGDIYRHIWLIKSVSEVAHVNLSEARGVNRPGSVGDHQLK